MFTLLTLIGSSAARAGNPDVKWRTIETEHFYVHYWAGNEEAAERTAMIAEKAYRELTDAWGHAPFLKTHVTLTDTQDTANGLASSLPYPRITAYTTAPESLSVLEAYDDWLDILITHELVHVIHLDTVHGLYRAANAVLGFGVLGKVTQPNILQPRWVVEGVATMHESKYSSMGRRRSAQFDAILRMAVLDRTFQSLDQVSTGARVYPHGTSVYLYGLHFMQYIAARYGQDKLRELSHIYATQLVPYGINKAIEKVVGVSFYELWEEFKRDTERRFEAQARQIRSRGLRQGRRLTFAGESTRYPMWSRDDAFIYFYKADGHREEGLKRLPATGGRIREGIGIGRQGADVDIEHVIDVEDPGEASFVGATDDIVFGMTGVHDLRYRWSDLWRWNGGDPKQVEQLTFGLRASEPHVSPDGRTVVFRRNDMAQSRLAFLELDTGDVVELPPFDRMSQVYTPRWHPGGEKVAFSAWEDGGYRDIFVYDRPSGQLQRITADRHIDMSPSWSPDGRYLLFVSDRSDVYNIYAWDTQSERLHQVSNVLGGAFEPMVSHDGDRLAYVGFTTAGYDLWVMDFDPQQWLEVMPTVTDLPVSEDPTPELPDQRGRPLSLSSRRYRPIETFFPRTIFPTALDFQSAQFGTSLGFSTGVADVLGFHTLLVNFNYAISDRVPTGSVSYTYSRLFPDFSVAASRNYFERGRGFTRYQYDRPEGSGDSYLATDYEERVSRVRLATGLPVIRHPRHRADFSVSYQWTLWENLDEGDLQVDPNAPTASLPRVGAAGEVGVGMSYSNEFDGAGRFTFGSEQGRAIGTSFSVMDPRLGGDFSDFLVSGTYRETIPMPWRGHQSLQLQFRGGLSAAGASGAQPYCVGDYQFGGDAIRTLLQRGRYFTGCSALLRGYPPGVARGNYFAVASFEYRAPLLDVDRGLGTLPFFFRRIGMIPFVDVGNAWVNEVRLKDLLVGVGATLVFTFELGYGDGINLLLQYAHGFDDELGIDNIRAVISTTF